MNCFRNKGLPSLCVKLRRTLKFCSGRSMRYLSRPIWQWSVYFVTLKLGMYSLPVAEKQVNKANSTELKF